MKELLLNLIDTSKNRLKNPVIGTFLLSWIILNWKAISVFILSDREIINKIKFIEENYLNINSSIFFPLLLTIIYIVFLPYLILFFDWLLIIAKEKRKTKQLTERLEDYKSKQKIAREEVKLEEIKTDFKEKKELHLKIKTLESKLDNKNKQINELSDLLDMSNLNNFESIVPLEDDSYNEFIKEDIFKYFYDIGKAISENGNFRNYIDTIIIEKYKYKDILIESENNNSGFDLTKKGKYFWKKFVLNLELDED